MKILPLKSSVLVVAIEYYSSKTIANALAGSVIRQCLNFWINNGLILNTLRKELRWSGVYSHMTSRASGTGSCVLHQDSFTFSQSVILVMVAVDLEPVPGTLGVRQKCFLHHTHTQPHSLLGTI